MLFSPQILVRTQPRGVVAGGGATTTWNPSDKSANITLSGGNLVATCGAGTISSLRAVASASSGKKYWECKATVFNDVGAQTVGAFGNASASLTAIFGTNNNSCCWLSDGRILINNSVVTTIATYSVNDTVCVSLDLTNSKVWFRKNGGNWNNDVIGNQDPANNIGGANISTMAAGPYFAAATQSINTDSYIANFGGSAYAQTPPSGFGNW